MKKHGITFGGETEAAKVLLASSLQNKCCVPQITCGKFPSSICCLLLLARMQKQQDGGEQVS
jgi:hypothetical protein